MKGPWRIPGTARGRLSNIVGIEIEIAKLVGKCKLSQNKDERDRSNAADELSKRSEQAISGAMLRTLGPKS